MRKLWSLTLIGAGIALAFCIVLAAHMILACPCEGADKEAMSIPELHSKYKYPDGFKFAFDAAGQPIQGIYYLTDIDNAKVREAIDFTKDYNVKFLRIDIYSPGGALLPVMDIIGAMEAYEVWGGIIETRALGFAASGGFLIFAGGTIGHRIAAPHAHLMFHQVRLAELRLSGADLRAIRNLYGSVQHLQDVCVQFLSERSLLSVQEINTLIEMGDFWITGREAVTFGFADALLGGSAKAGSAGRRGLITHEAGP